MGFFDLKATCSICSKQIGWNRYELADKKWICKACLKNCGNLTTSLKKMTVMDINKVTKVNKAAIKELKSFKATKRIGNFMEIDSKQKKWHVFDAFLGRKVNPKIYKYSDIVDFELLENGDLIEKDELGKDIEHKTFTDSIGAAFDGIIGGKKDKSTCDSLKIKITVNDIDNPVVYINFLRTPTKKDSSIYINMCNSAKECLSLLQSISNIQKVVKKHKAESKVSDADEILKFKNLLDDGIITQEEFDAKKKQLLGL